MSVTGHHPKIDAEEHYRTPEWVVSKLLARLGLSADHARTAVDLGAGTGAIGIALRNWFGKNLQITGVENDPQRALEASKIPGVYQTVLTADALAPDMVSLPNFDLAVINPPFSRAIDFTRVAMKLVPYGVVAVLQRESWLSCGDRAPFAIEHPCGKLILVRRPSFAKVVRECSLCRGTGLVVVETGSCKRCRGTGKTTTSTDASTYAWHVWGRPDLVSRWELLP